MNTKLYIINSTKSRDGNDNYWTSLYEVQVSNDLEFSATRVNDRDIIKEITGRENTFMSINGHCPYEMGHISTVNAILNGGEHRWGMLGYRDGEITLDNEGNYTIPAFIAGYDSDGEATVVVSPELKVVSKNVGVTACQHGI